jgi:hypothetical protein
MMQPFRLPSIPGVVRFALALLWLLPVHVLIAETYYVAPHGSDSRRGSQSDPFRTIQKAADIVKPGDTVIIRDGAYTGDEEAVVEVYRSGTRSQWITFKAENKWGAVLDGRDFKTVHGIIIARGVGYVRFEGLQIQKIYSGAFSASEDTHDLYYYRNLIHDIGRVCTESFGGLVGFRDKDTSARFTFDSNVLHAIGREHPSDGCLSLTGNYKNHDHGMYLHGKDHRIINNLFYDFRSGWAIQSSEGASGWLIANNTFAFANPNREGHIVLWRKNSNFTIANNIFYQPNGAAIYLNPCSGKSGIVVRNNLSTGELIYNGDDGGVSCRNVMLVENMIRTDPALVNPQARDFRLTSSSPALNKADATISPEFDLEGAPRPKGKASALGAFELRSPAGMGDRPTGGNAESGRQPASQRNARTRVK